MGTNERSMSVKPRSVSRVVIGLVLATIAGEWSCWVEPSHAIEVESRAEKEVEARLNRAPLGEGLMAPWLERLIGHGVVYAPLPPFI